MTGSDRESADRRIQPSRSNPKAEEEESLLYQLLRQLARRHFRREGIGHTLQPTALANEAYLRLRNDRAADSAQLTRFKALAARHMRRILVDHYRRKSAVKRFGQSERVTLSDEIALSERSTIDLMDLHEALEKLGALHERRARVVECRFFGAMSVQETAQELGIAERTVKKDWEVARAWLRRELSHKREHHS